MNTTPAHFDSQITTTLDNQNAMNAQTNLPAPLPTTMTAVTQTVYGAPEQLGFAEVAVPELGADEIRVRVFAAAVTQGDRRLRTGDFPGITFVPGRLSMGITGPRQTVPGTAFAGRVVSVGADVTRFEVGQDVFGSSLHGAHADYVVVAADGPVAAMPARLSYEEAATLPYGGVTAVAFLRDMADVQPGEHVCILGASGGVGRVAVQVAKALGAEVTGVASAGKLDMVRALGADHVVDYRSADFRDAGEYDVILDTIGTSSFGESRDSLRDGGRYLSLMVTAGLLVRMLTTKLFGSRRAIAGVALGSPSEMEFIAELAGEGAVSAVIDSVWDFDEVRDAHERLDSGESAGSVVVRVADAPLARQVGAA